MANQSNIVPPHGLEAEKSTIGSLLVDKDAIVKISDFLKPEDFYHDTHRMIYQGICDLYDKRSPIDLVTLTSILEDRDQLKSIGGASYLALLANEVPTATHIFQYATIVKEKAILRRLILAGDAIKGFGYMENENIENLIDQSEKTLFNVSQTFLADRFVHIKDVLNKLTKKFPTCMIRIPKKNIAVFQPDLKLWIIFCPACSHLILLFWRPDLQWVKPRLP